MKPRTIEDWYKPAGENRLPPMPHTCRLPEQFEANREFVCLVCFQSYWYVEHEFWRGCYEWRWTA